MRCGIRFGFKKGSTSKEALYQRKNPSNLYNTARMLIHSRKFVEGTRNRHKHMFHAVAPHLPFYLCYYDTNRNTQVFTLQSEAFNYFLDFMRNFQEVVFFNNKKKKQPRITVFHYNMKSAVSTCTSVLYTQCPVIIFRSLITRESLAQTCCAK